MTRTLVIGAGVAGLAAARRLRILGHDVEVFEAAARAGGRLVNQPICVVEPEARALLAGLGLEKPPVTTVAQEVPPPATGAGSEGEKRRRLVTRWRGALSARGDPTEKTATPPAAPSALASGLAIANALAQDVPIRFGWEVVDITATDAAATVRYVAPSGERTIDAAGVIATMPFGPSRVGERGMTVFFECASTESGDGPMAWHRIPPTDSGATASWTLQAEGRVTTRIDLSPDASAQLWDLPDEEVGTTFWDLLPPDFPLVGSRPLVQRFHRSESPLPKRAPGESRVLRLNAAGHGLGAALAAGICVAERTQPIRAEPSRDVP